MTRDQLCARIPHAGRMCLLERLLAWDDNHILCSTWTHRDPANPLRRDGKLSAIHVVEYAGQAAALHGALVKTAGVDGKGSRTLLAAVNYVRCEVDFLDPLNGPMEISAARELSSVAGSIYYFSVAVNAEHIAQGRFSVMSTGPD